MLCGPLAYRLATTIRLASPTSPYVATVVRSAKWSPESTQMLVPSYVARSSPSSASRLPTANAEIGWPASIAAPTARSGPPVAAAFQISG